MLDIKNNKQRGKSNAVSVASVLSAGVLKWLRGWGMEEVQLRNLAWSKILQPRKKVCYNLRPCSPLQQRDVRINALHITYCKSFQTHKVRCLLLGNAEHLMIGGDFGRPLSFGD